MATRANMGKFTDYIDKYDGENPSEYAQFKRDFEQTLTMLDVPVEKKYALFKACLTGRPRDSANDFIDEFVNNHPEINTGTREEKKQLAEQLYTDLRAHIGADPMVVGHNPSKDCRIKLAKLTQGDRESVRTYYRRFRKILDFGEAQNPPVIIDEESRIGHFIGLTESMGLRPELQMLTNNHSPTPTTLSEWVDAAQAAEDKIKNHPHMFSQNSTLWVATTEDDGDPGPRSTQVPNVDPSPHIQRGSLFPTKRVRFQAEKGGRWSAKPKTPQYGSRYADKPYQKQKQFRNRNFVNSVGTGKPQERKQLSARENKKQEWHKARRGTHPDICLQYLSTQECKWGDSCHKLHLVSLDQDRDVRKDVKTKPTKGAKEIASTILRIRKEEKERGADKEELECMMVALEHCLQIEESEEQCQNPDCGVIGDGHFVRLYTDALTVCTA